MTSIREIKVGNAAFRVNAEGYEPYWDEYVSGHWEPTTLQLIQKYLGPGKKFIDCGGWIGGTALPAAAHGAEVIVYEPNPVAVKLLQQNIQLNAGFEQLITIKEVALHTRTGFIGLYNDHSARYRSTRSTISVLQGDCIEVACLDVTTAVQQDRWQQADMIKLDIEAGEYALIPAITKALGPSQPPLLIEFHPTYLNGATFLQAVKDCSRALSQWPACVRVEGNLLAIAPDVRLETIIAQPYMDPIRGQVINPRVLFSPIL